MAAATDINGSLLRQAQAAAVEALLSQRSAEGHWEGSLSSSALSTAAAAFALDRAGGLDCAAAVSRAMDWLAAHQNADGGFGDTTCSRSNLSTTVLCWCALGAAATGDAHSATAARAQGYVARACGSLEPGRIAKAVASRYGRDRTFSAPILTMAALAGRLGPEPACWRHVPQLPFELGWLSHAALRRIRLPVVSYALPALIAIGQVRHARRPGRNPITRLLRNLSRGATLEKLRDIQPASGGYLEAAPLTAFVLMSLAGLREDGLPPYSPADEVIARAIAFLMETVRPDGSWPIDTNLSNWVTTLAVTALPDGVLDAPQQAGLARRLLACQYAVEHPYTQAAAGGWAWTDLSGGVPDADDTAGALRALKRLAPADPAAAVAAAAGCRWLLDLQNADGGMPTFCRGWGRLDFDRSCHDLTAHALLAWTQWRADAPPELRGRLDAGVSRALRYVLRSQGPAGQWTPLWFGNQNAPDEANTVYGTARVLLALTGIGREGDRPHLAEAISRGAEYLLACQGGDGGFAGQPRSQAGCDAPPSVEETAVAVEAMSNVILSGAAGADQAERLKAAVAAGCGWLIDATRSGCNFPAAPVGLYFARLWYFERLYPIIFTVAALTAGRKALSI